MFPDGIDVVLLANSELNQFTLDRQALAYKVHNTITRRDAIRLCTFDRRPRATGGQRACSIALGYRKGPKFTLANVSKWLC